jgi:hypothetical protein
MGPLEQLFALEVEFHRRLRCELQGNATALHIRYALQSGYERLIAQVGDGVTFHTIERLRGSHAVAGDVRDLIAARDSLTCLLGVWPYTKPPGSSATRRV